MLPFKIDLSNISGTATAQLLFPFVPGLVLVVGGLGLRTDLAKDYFALPFIGYYIKITLVILGAYVAGLFLATVVIGIIGGIGGLLGEILGHLLRNRFLLTPWEQKHWRLLAQRFIDDGLSPAELDLPSEGEALAAQVAIAKMYDEKNGPNEGSEQKKIIDKNLAQRAATFEWRNWYWVLNVYFFGPDTPPAFQMSIATYISQAAYCSAVAVLILIHFRPVSHPIVSIVCYLVLSGAFLEYLLTSLNPAFTQDDGSRQCAAILNVLRSERLAREAGSRKQE